VGGSLSWWDRVFLDRFYRRKLRSFFDPAQRVGWYSATTQRARFEAMMPLGDLMDARVLDVGCGLGDLYGFLEARGWRGSYTGFDRLEDMVVEARRLHPGARFVRHNLLNCPTEERWDYVFMSGLFNHRIRDNWAWVAEGVVAARGVAEKGLAFNLLGDTQTDQDGEFFYASRGDLERFLEALAPGRWRVSLCPVTRDLTAFVYPN
jgi:SAM-dependent methyltransferase